MSKNQNQLQALRDANKKSNLETRAFIREALFQLIETNDYDDIKNTDIINKSGVSRSAFYRNFYTKHDIIVDYFNHIGAEFDTISGTDILENWEFVFRVIQKYRKEFYLLDKAGKFSMVLDQLNSQVVPKEDRYGFVLWNGMIYNASLEYLRSNSGESIEDTLNKTMTALKRIAHDIDEMD